MNNDQQIFDFGHNNKFVLLGAQSQELEFVLHRPH